MLIGFVVSFMYVYVCIFIKFVLECWSVPGTSQFIEVILFIFHNNPLGAARLFSSIIYKETEAWRSIAESFKVI